LAAQTYPPAQAIGAGDRQVPFEQLPMPTMLVPEQLGAPHAAVGNEHSPSLRPAHAPAHTPAAPHDVRLPCGAPDATAVHVPSSPGRSHAMHDAAQALLQQVPSGAQVVPVTQPPAVVWQVCPRLLLQRPVASQVPGHTVVLGSSALTMGRHNPAMVESEQERHAPVHALSQQTPSTQLPIVHSAAPWQDNPLPFLGRQTPVGSQNCVDVHGTVALQPPEHVVAFAHRLLAHAMVIADVQEPAPLQTLAVVTEPLAQLAGVHWVALLGKVHWAVLVPLHVPRQGAVPAHAVRAPRGSPVTGAQVPSVAPLQLSHWPPQALLQQTPSVQ
jgi:hypothetical protein